MEEVGGLSCPPWPGWSGAWQLGQRSPLKIKQLDVMLGDHCSSQNLRQGRGALLTLVLGTRAGDTVDNTLPCYPGTLLMQQQGSCSGKQFPWG